MTFTPDVALTSDGFDWRVRVYVLCMRGSGTAGCACCVGGAGAGDSAAELKSSVRTGEPSAATGEGDAGARGEAAEVTGLSAVAGLPGGETASLGAAPRPPVETVCVGGRASLARLATLRAR